MRRFLALISVLIFSTIIAEAGTIYVEIGNDTPLIREGFTELAPGQALEAGAYVQFIWKADNIGYQSDNLEPDLLNPGEYLLYDGFAGTAGIFDFGAQLFGDADVGGNNILNGYSNEKGYTHKAERRSSNRSGGDGNHIR